MDIKEYIASGVLEAYWMGELSEDEMTEVDRLAQRHVEIKAALDSLKETINHYARTVHQTPERDVLAKVLNSIDEQEEETTPEIPLASKKAVNTTKKVSPFPLWSIAASFLLLISIGFNIYFFNQLQNSRDIMRTLTQEKTLLADRVETTGQQLDYAKLRIAHFLNEDNIHVRMDGSELSPQSYANVFWNKKTNAVFISVDNLPEPPHGHQYQLWAIKPGLAPIDAGIFDHNALVQELKIIRGEVLAFAVTLEKEGGTQQATVEKTYVKGFLKKS